MSVRADEGLGRAQALFGKENVPIPSGCCRPAILPVVARTFRKHPIYHTLSVLPYFERVVQTFDKAAHIVMNEVVRAQVFALGVMEVKSARSVVAEAFFAVPAREICYETIRVRYCSHAPPMQHPASRQHVRRSSSLCYVPPCFSSTSSAAALGSVLRM